MPQPLTDSIPRLVPQTVTAAAESAGRWRGAFGRRFFIGIILGLVWIGPAWWNARFIWMMAAWDFLMLLAWLADWRRLPKPEALTVSRIWFEPLAQGQETPVALEIENRSSVAIEASLEDDAPPSLRATLPTVEARVPAAAQRQFAVEPGRARAAYAIQPSARGDLLLGRVFFRYQSPLKLAERWASADLRQIVRVYPNLQESKRHAFYLMRSRQIELEKRLKRQPGVGREFESLREYRQGDELRDVCWTATARRAKLISKVYRVERSQTVLIVVDAGRLMLARVSPIPPRAANALAAEHGASRPAASASHTPAGMNKLDYAVTAALALAQVALYSGDRVGLLGYGRRLSVRLGAARGSRHLRVLLERLATLHGELVEADHARAADSLLAEHTRRSLIVWLTDLAETAATPEVIEAASRLLRRHLVLFVAIGQPELGQLVASRPATVDETYRYVAAQEMIQRRELLLRRLRQQGAMTMELTPGQLAAGIVSKYLEVKERSLL